MFNTVFANETRQNLDHFRRSVDQLFDNFLGFSGSSAAAGRSGERTSQWTFSPVIESAWTDNHLYLRAVLPGIAESDVKVSVQNNQLVIEGERKQPEGYDKNAYTQLAYGRFYTAVALPSNLDLEKISCRLHEGVLDITVPLAESMKPRQIQIQTGEGRKAIGAR